MADLDRSLPAEAAADGASRRGDTSAATFAYRRRVLAWAWSLVIARLLVAVAVPAVRGVAGGPARCAAPVAGQAGSQWGDRRDRRGRLTATWATAPRLGGVASADSLLWSLLVQLRLWDQDGCMLQAGPFWTVCVSAGDTTTAETAIRRPGAGKPVGKLVVVAHAVSPGVVAVRVTPGPDGARERDRVYACRRS